MEKTTAAAHLAAIAAEIHATERRIAGLAYFIAHAPAGINRGRETETHMMLKHQTLWNLNVDLRAAMAAYEAA